jgi:tryptophanyl-tRNA synthetase
MKERILTGDRPTGRLHLGHYVGSLRNRVKYQSSHECFFVIADLHTLTTRPGKDQIMDMNRYIYQIVLDYLAAGIDPEKSTIFLQSTVPEISELNTLLGMLVTAPRLERIPSLKEMARSEGLKTMSFGLLGYPVLMSADILLPRANLVPVGSDNRGNVELAREIARRFNHDYGEVFPIPEIEMEGTLVGTDGQAKMSKSLDNAIFLSDDPEEVNRKVMGMYTDPKRIRADIPGEVEGNPVFIYHDIFNPDIEEVQELKDRYRLGSVGDVEVKRKLVRAINLFLEPHRIRRDAYASQPDLVLDILREGAERMRAEARETLALVRSKTGLDHYYRLVGDPSARDEPARALSGLAFL